jgi:hypothetical protein
VQARHCSAKLHRAPVQAPGTDLGQTAETNQCTLSANDDQPALSSDDDRPALPPDAACTIVTAAMPPRILDRSPATPSMIAHIASDKFAALSLHRQEDRFARLGVPLDRGTMCLLARRPTSRHRAPRAQGRRSLPIAYGNVYCALSGMRTPAPIVDAEFGNGTGRVNIEFVH